MRPLTQKEIDQAPDWATRYTIDATFIRWSDENYFMWSNRKIKRERQGILHFDIESQPIPRKEFDISQAEQELSAANERIKELERELLRCDTAFKSLKITTGLSKCTTRHANSGLSIASKLDNRHWLGQLPDADLFKLYQTTDISCTQFGAWIAHNHGGHTNTLYGKMMPTLTGDEWRNSKISIDELRAWQGANK